MEEGKGYKKMKNLALKDLQDPKFGWAWGLRTWKPFMEKYDCQKIAELGVCDGDNFMRMIEHNPTEAVAVDAWIDDGIVSRNDEGYSQAEQDELYRTFKKNTKDMTFVHIFREYTFNAAKHFPDNYFDLVYIDADHTYEGCKKDLESWYPKVKKGKFLLGDDYVNNHITRPTGVRFGVVEAVIEFAKKHNLTIFELPGHGWGIVK